MPTQEAAASAGLQSHERATLLRNAEGVLSYCKTVLTSGKMEGINRKIDGLFSGRLRLPVTNFLRTASL